MHYSANGMIHVHFNGELNV